jgi:hypothetical protein
MERDWEGTDPYEGLNASRGFVSPLRRTPLGRRLLVQAVKRSPLNLRPLLGISSEPSAATVSWVVSAYARNGFLGPDDARRGLEASLRLLEELRSPRYEEPCWGYHFDIQTRVLFYPRGQPNTIATAFAGLALLDAYRVLGRPELLSEGRDVGRFFLRHVPQTETDNGAYFGYAPGDRSPIHNASMLVASLLARLAAEGEDTDDFAIAAEAAVRYTTARQRPDGSWPYGERPNLDWVDNFHTGYVLDALRSCADAGVAVTEAEEAWTRGLRYYRRELFLADGTPKYYATKTFPIDAQSVAQAIQTLAIAVPREPSCEEAAWHVLEFALRRMLRSDELPLFQRRRLWTNRALHVRWVVAPMLLALCHLLTLEGVPPQRSGEVAAREVA